MIFGINASAVSRQKGGASFYIINIIKGLAAINHNHKYYIFTTPSIKGEFDNLPSNFIVLPIAPSNLFLRIFIWEQIVLPFIICKKYRINTLFSPNYTAPVFHPGTRSVVTIFDLSFFPLSKLYPFSRRLFKFIIHLSIRTSNAVIAISKFTKKDILRFIGPYDSKVNVIYCAVDSRFLKAISEQDIVDIKKYYHIDGEYILFTGFLEPRKNLERLLLAFASICGKVKHKLVIAGGEGWWYDATYKRVIELNIKDNVIFTGYVPDEKLPALYSGATLFVFPSLYEGFGIAALESICCGTPVLASNNTALPEVVNEAGAYIDPYDIDSITVELLRLLNTEHELNKLRLECLNVKTRFSWEKAASETQAVLDSAV